ncbi:MAG: PEGA domain-containing protein [Candidatus Omnitrophica bacterium]|nr:PEGA domain-containing protein [Candidatus Omnitrophota bacterium]
MQDKDYLVFRHIFFWLFFVIFVIFTPLITFYSLGYKLDSKTKRFERTGAISIQTEPRGAEISINGKKRDCLTPTILKEIMPGKYTVLLGKKDFYSYAIPVVVKSSFVSEIDVTMIPKMKKIARLKLDRNVYKFFSVKYMFGKKILAFTDEGIYLVDEDFTGAKKIADLYLDRTQINTISGLKEGRTKIVFWNTSNVWMLELPKIQDIFQDKAPAKVELVYTGEECVKDVFFGFKEKYLIVQDGLNIVVIDTKNQNVVFQIMELRSVNSSIFYDSESDTIYVKDKISPSETFSLYRVDLIKLIHGERTD